MQYREGVGAGGRNKSCLSSLALAHGKQRRDRHVETFQRSDSRQYCCIKAGCNNHTTSSFTISDVPGSNRAQSSSSIDEEFFCGLYPTLHTNTKVVPSNKSRFLPGLLALSIYHSTIYSLSY